MGTLWIDHYGEMEIVNHRTKERCVVTIVERPWRTRGPHLVRGDVFDATGKERWRISGKLDDKLIARPVDHPPSPVLAGQDGRTSLSGSRRSLSHVLWRPNPPLPESESDAAFHFTRFAVEINQITPEMAEHLPPTDSRRRPDIRAWENGECDLAASEKRRLEEKQRQLRRPSRDSDSVLVPLWFEKSLDDKTGAETWIYNGKYWDMRLQKSFPERDIF